MFFSHFVVVCLFQCSYSVCLKSYADNTDAVEQYEATWQSRGTEQFDCYYSTDNLRHVILQKMHTQQDVLHSMLWPSLIIVVCGVIFLRLEMKRRDIPCCGCCVENAQESGPGTGSDNKSSSTHAQATGSADPSAQRLLDPRNGRVAQEPQHEKDSLLRYKPELKGPGIECSLTPYSYTDKNAHFISSSLSSLDRLAKTVDKSKLSASNGRVMSCVSADGLRPPGGVREPPDGSPSSASCSPSHRQKSSLAGSTYSPYNGSPHGSKIKGLETPV